MARPAHIPTALASAIFAGTAPDQIPSEPPPAQTMVEPPAEAIVRCEFYRLGPPEPPIPGFQVPGFRVRADTLDDQRSLLQALHFEGRALLRGFDPQREGLVLYHPKGVPGQDWIDQLCAGHVTGSVQPIERIVFDDRAPGEIPTRPSTSSQGR